jgi:hypothetical protein
VDDRPVEERGSGGGGGTEQNRTASRAEGCALFICPPWRRFSTWAGGASPVDAWWEISRTWRARCAARPGDPLCLHAFLPRCSPPLPHGYSSPLSWMIQRWRQPRLVGCCEIFWRPWYKLITRCLSIVKIRTTYYNVQGGSVWYFVKTKVKYRW